MKTCPVCDEEFEPQYNTLQKTCDTKCAIVFGRNQAKKKADKAHTERKKDFKLHDVPAQHKLTQPRFNLMRRLEELAYYRRMEEYPRCISCERMDTELHGGHFNPVSTHGEYRYSEKNLHLQCVPCNNYNSGNRTGYIKGLARRYGDYEAFLIVDKFDRHTDKIWTGPELVAMRKKYNANIRQLESET